MLTEATRARLRIWLVPLVVLLAAAMVLIIGGIVADVLVHGAPRGPWAMLLDPSREAIELGFGGVPEVIAAVFGVAITVVSIVVQLAATRYTPRVSEMFFRDPVNLAVVGLFVISCVHSLWVSFGLDGDFVPKLSVVLSMGLMTLSLLLLIPYFAYVFWFLNPQQVIRAIRTQVIARVQRARSGRQVDAAKHDVLQSIEQIADVAMSAIDHKDKGLAMDSVRALGALVRDYMAHERDLPPRWFSIEGELAENPDFVSMPPEVLADLACRQLWVEMKVLRQYQMIYNESLNKMRDINYLVAIDTRQIAQAAMELDQPDVVALCVKFFNTYLRATLNAKDVRTAYNVLNQYRLLAEGALEQGRDALVVEIAGYFKYYGQLAFSSGLAFILETAAYDLCALCERAHVLGAASQDEVLRIFLEVDKESESQAQETGLRGVRKAQVRLATWYLWKGDEARARRVFLDMKDERPERLRSIREELLAIRSKEFWEVIDRGTNFDYLPQERKEKLEVFFSWFDASTTRSAAVGERS